MSNDANVIPFVNLKAQYLSIKDEIDSAVLNILDKTQFILGPEVEGFEKDFAAAHSSTEAVAVNSGTSALHLALLAAGVGPGDEVITIPYTFVATVSAIVYANATPVFVDVDPVSFTMDPSKIEAAITPRTKAILPVHLYGQMADMDPIMEIAKRHNLVVIEDAAQAHLAEYKGRRAGSIGDMGCFSFYPGKNLGAYGEGGAVVTSNPAYAKTMRMLRDWGQEKKYNHVLKGFNYRMEGFQGAILRVKLRHLERWTEGRRAAAKVYGELLKDAGITLPTEVADRRHVWHVYALFTEDRDALQAHLNEQKVQSGIHYPIPVHLQPAFRDLGYHEGDFPVSERLARTTLSIPMCPELSREQLERVATVVSQFSESAVAR